MRAIPPMSSFGQNNASWTNPNPRLRFVQTWASNLQRIGRLSDTMELGSVIYSGEDWKMGDIAFTHFSETERLMAK